MKKRRNYKSNRLPINYSITRAILDILLDTGNRMPLSGTPFGRSKGSWQTSLGVPESPPWRYNRAIEYLKRRSEIKIIEEYNKTFVELTNKGKVRALLFRLYKDFELKKTWDGKWRVIMWDIPESSSLERNKIRRLVKDLGFYQLQKSVFITPYSLPSSAVEYLRESRLLRYIRFLRVDKLEDDRFLKRHYRLG